MSNREIAERLGRSDSGIRNLRYRKRLIRKAVDETKSLLQRREEFRGSVSILEAKQKELQLRVKDLEVKKERVERFLQLNKSQLEWFLTEGLITLKKKRPELFILSGSEQFAMLLRILSRL